MKAITETSGESFSHRILWKCAKLQHNNARAIEKGRKYFDLSTMLMAYLTYEAYLNFVGDRIDPDTWKNEKKYFSQNEYFGVEGKLKRISEICDGVKIDKSCRPYQTIKDLGKLRTSIVHAKVYKYNETIEHTVDTEPEIWPKDGYQYVTKENSNRAMEDVEEFIEWLHVKIKPFCNDHWFGDKALGGITGYATSSSKVEEINHAFQLSDKSGD